MEVDLAVSALVALRRSILAARKPRDPGDCEGLGIDAACAAHMMILVSAMRLGVYKTKAAYVKAIREAEKELGVKLADKMPPYAKGGDSDFIDRFVAGDAKAKKMRKRA